MPVFLPYAANHVTLGKTPHMRREQMSQAPPTAPCRPISTSRPTRRWPSSGRRSAPRTSPTSPARCAEGREDLVSRGHDAGGGRRAAAVLHLGDHQLPDPGRARAFPPGAARQPRPAPGPQRDRGRRQVVHPRRGAAAARAFRRRGQPRQGIPALAPAGPAGQDRARWRTSRAASARPRRRRISRCRRRSTATGCW